MATTASTDAPDRLPRYGGFSRFELELEVRSHRPWPTCCPLFATDQALVRAVPCQSCLSQLSRPAEDFGQARLCRLPRLPAILQGAKILQVPAVRLPCR